MIRWPLFVIGLGLMVCALIARFQQPALSTEARKIHLKEAVALAGGATKSFVELEARVDTSRRIFPTGDDVARPVYTGKTPDQIYPIQTNSELAELNALLGNMVRAETGLEAHYLRLQSVRDRAFEDEQVLSERLLAPVRGSGLRLWALSSVLPENDPKGKAWISQGPVQGYLTRFKEVEANRSAPKFQHDLDNIYRSVEQAFGQPVPENAFLLLTDGRSTPQPVAYFYSPIVGGEETLFFELTPAGATNLPNVLRGLLEPADLKLYADFENALGKKLPARIAILRPESAESFNTRRAAGVRDVFFTGAVLAGLGLMAILWKRIRKRRTA